MEKFKLRNTKIFIIYFLIILFSEIMFKILINIPIFNISLLYIILYDLGLSIFLSMLNSLFKPKINKILFFISIIIIAFIFSLHYCVYKIFGFYFEITLLGAADQVIDFADSGVKLVLQNILGVLIMFLPCIICITFNRYIRIEKDKWPNLLIKFLSCGLIFGIMLFSFKLDKNNDIPATKLYFNVNNIELSIKRFGVLNATILNLNKQIFGISEEIITIDNEEKEEIKEIEKEEDDSSEIVYDYNNLNIDFKDLIEKESNNEIKNMHQYFKNEEGTLKNKYTGYFKDKNLILFMAESFNEIAVDQKRTPTLYKLINNGFVFNNFYTPTISSTIGGEFQEITGLVAAAGFIGPWKSGNNDFPFGMANVFKDMNYNTYAYHNHNYYFQNRNKYLKAIGFDNFLACNNGLEKKINCHQWPESDIEMINATIDDYINSSKPFFTYYVTVSGHGGYLLNGAIAKKYRDKVKDLPYTNEVKAYLAQNMELDRALEILINKLEENGKLDDTVIALVGDHYPYMLDIDEINEVIPNKDPIIEINHSNFILWNNKMDKVNVDKVGSQIDVIPTLYNLFNVPYDSRLIIGKDILSTSPGLAIFGNRSWVSDYGKYYAGTGKFILNKDKSINDNYINYVNKVVANRMNMSALIMKNNYYKYFK